MIQVCRGNRSGKVVFRTVHCQPKKLDPANALLLRFSYTGIAKSMPAKRAFPNVPLLLFAGVLASLSLFQVAGQESHPQETNDLQAKADAIRASAADLFKLKRIPWITDPAEGFRLAKEENRPVFFYMQVGDPLEDC